MNEVAATLEPKAWEVPEVKQASQTVAPMRSAEVASPFDRLIQAATDPSVDVEKMERLLGVAERWREQEARIAYANAIADAKPQLPVILKTNEVDFTTNKGRTNYKFEDLAGIAEQVDPVLQKHGLSYRFRTTNDGSNVTVTCVVQHRAGHSEETSLTAGTDTSGNKNAIQAIGSTVTYLQRYTLKAALGLAAAKDDDARTGSPSPEPEATSGKVIEPLALMEVRELLGKTGRTEGQLLGWVNAKYRLNLENVGDMPAELAKPVKAFLLSKVEKPND